MANPSVPSGLMATTTPPLHLHLLLYAHVSSPSGPDRVAQYASHSGPLLLGTTPNTHTEGSRGSGQLPPHRLVRSHFTQRHGSLGRRPVSPEYSSSDANEGKNRTTNDPPTTCDECANNGLKAPAPESNDHTADPHDVASDFQRSDDLATTLANEDHLSKTCSALLDEPPAPNSEAVATEMRDRHPPPREEDMARRKLPSPFCPSPPRLSAFAHPSCQTQRRDRRAFGHNILREACSQVTMRSQHAVVIIMVPGNIPSPVVSWNASASLTRPQKKDLGTGQWPLEGLSDVSLRNPCWPLFPKT